MTIFDSLVAAAERTGSEHSNQVVLFAWAAESGIPELKWLFAIPNGFYATPAQKAKMKAEGLRSGVWDVFLPIAGKWPDNHWNAGLFIELKHEKYRKQAIGGLTDKQIEFRKDLECEYAFVICYSWQEARDAILNYLGRKE